MSNRHSPFSPKLTMSRYANVLRVLVVFAALITPAAATAQRGSPRQSDADWLADCNYGRNRDYRERFCEVRHSEAPAPRGPLTVDGLRNGGVSVIGAAENKLTITTRIQAEGRTMAEARDIARQVRTVVSGSNIRAEGPRTDDDAWWSANLIIWAPRRSDLRLTTSNGPVSVEDISGDMDLETRNGPLALHGLSGNVRARSSNGPLSIVLTGSRWEGSGLDAETRNGPLSLRIPDAYSARLEAGTNNGPMSLGFPVTVVGRIGRSISTNLGSGGPTIRAITHNGPLSIARR
jgi:hypothetical protein